MGGTRKAARFGLGCRQVPVGRDGLRLQHHPPWPGDHYSGSERCSQTGTSCSAVHSCLLHLRNVAALRGRRDRSYRRQRVSGRRGDARISKPRTKLGDPMASIRTETRMAVFALGFDLRVERAAGVGGSARQWQCGAASAPRAATVVPEPDGVVGRWKYARGPGAEAGVEKLGSEDRPLPTVQYGSWTGRLH
ncbi:hypothetical protein CMUS01_04211 [Colletotrichum musicola]|uniref:Uncharacterized protein n=1 Tax=Colletotrichum musicola TaxID=2175873 RepID=A0A8H6KXT0_9PEZI|nr:hypothetical protein CMUS01_04211 [Colletotrichum musicola]